MAIAMFYPLSFILCFFGVASSFSIGPRVKIKPFSQRNIFVITTNSHCHLDSSCGRVVSLNISEDSYDDKEIKEMEDLIISLSLEPTDESRRERVQSVFEEALARPNGMPRHFSDLFDQALIAVGDRVKEEAQQAAVEAQEYQESDNVGEPNTKVNESENSSQQWQLWALVDMMVQSKTIVKRDTGELGSRGTFQ